MDCPDCHTANSAGQKYCGACGRQLESECSRCGAPNPPHYKFCGQCGADLIGAGVLVLAPSGLITSANPKALELLGYAGDEIEGKPFSLFVERDDLVVFFSHWNELRRSDKHRACEIALKHKRGDSIYLLLDFGCGDPRQRHPSEIRILLSKISESRKVSAKMQLQEDLLNLVFSTTDAINTVSARHLDRSIEDILKKVCLFAESDRCFIWRFDRRRKSLEPAYQWRRTPDAPDAPPAIKSVPLVMMKRAVVRLRQDQAYVVHDVAKLLPAERYELMAWHQADLGAVVCHLIYAAKRPIGIIGLAKKIAAGEWSPDYVALVKFIGQLLSGKLPFTGSVPTAARDARPRPGANDGSPSSARSGKPKVIDFAGKRSWQRTIDEARAAGDGGRYGAAEPSRFPDLGRPMLLETLSGCKSTDQQPVFPRDDGLILLTCPRCGLQESVSQNQFEKLGNALSVTCSCRKKFTAVLEKRRAFRKQVRLEGHFTLKGDLGPTDKAGSIWGLMVVRDLSKAGLRFASQKAELVHPGDQLMVRFHLDNSNHALIHKPVRVVSVCGDEVGCRFEGDDSYDITLGFYFI